GGGAVRVRSQESSVALSNEYRESFAGNVAISASGATGGGSVDLQGRNVLAVAPGTTLAARATASGVGGQVRTASGGLLDVRGVAVDAGGPGGAGGWTIESGASLAIVHAGDDAWDDEGVSLVDDAALSAALDAGGSVSVVVPPNEDFAQINIAPGVAIAYTGGQRVGLSLQAQGGQIVGGLYPNETVGPWSIVSSGGGALDIALDAASSLYLLGGTLASAGGDVLLRSRASASTGVTLSDVGVDSGGGDVLIDGGESAQTSVQLLGTEVWTGGGALALRGSAASGVGVAVQLQSDLDTRVGRADDGAGGALTIEGTAAGAFGAGVALSRSTLHTATGGLSIAGRFAAADGAAGTGVSLVATALTSTSGAIDIDGRATGDGTGVSLAGYSVIDAGTAPQPGLISSTTGAIGITGVGSASAGGVGGSGVSVHNYEIASGSGAIRLSGRGMAGTAVADPDGPAGLWLSQGTRLASGSGDIQLDGYAAGAGAGIRIEAAGTLGDAAGIEAGGNVVLRAGNTGGDALRIAGSVAAQGMVNVRAGSVDAAGVASDDTAAAMALGGAGGFVSMASLANIAAPDLVIGHAGHAGTITVSEALARSGNLSLHNAGGAGGIVLDAAVDVGAATLALVSGGSISQSAGGGITAGALLARSTGGDVALASAANTVGTLAGDAAGGFDFRDSDALTIGSVDAQGAGSAGAGAALAGTGLASGGGLRVQTLAGDLTLGAAVAAVTDADLVTAGRLQNTAGATITAGNRWRVWADTWIGETRGGLAGSGPLPNLFNCSYAGACGVDAGIAGNHFIYRQQPTLTVTIGDATREYGLDNPAFAFAVDGLVFADDLAGNVLAGTPTTTATLGSDVGAYAIGGAFGSAAGYAVQVNPGTLAITPATLTYIADPISLFYGQPFGGFSGTVAGLRNGDTLADFDGTLVFSTTGQAALFPGVYPILGGGLASGNYVFAQAPANFTALQVAGTPPLDLPDLVRLPPETYVYSSNVGQMAMCAATGPLDGTRLDGAGDTLGREWARVRSRPNLTSCVATDRKNSCSDF
ncbi:MAG TPA: MBG domain-containing protein, partial [Luteimonas sp.]|nr:MBG domain-containing protein [Luteimonas sp.]